jgi:hypothetical protein
MIAGRARRRAIPLGDYPTMGIQASVPLFDGIHVFTPHADVPDDSALRLVVLPLERCFIKDAPHEVEDAVREHLRTHGVQPRHRANRLIFVAPDQAVLKRLQDATRVRQSGG